MRILKNWSVYIVKCRDNSFYTGISKDVERRFKEHQYNNKKGSKYCIRLRPLKLVYKSLPLYNRSEASKKEYCIKKLSHAEKKKFIKENK